MVDSACQGVRPIAAAGPTWVRAPRPRFFGGVGREGGKGGEGGVSRVPGTTFATFAGFRRPVSEKRRLSPSPPGSPGPRHGPS